MGVHLRLHLIRLIQHPKRLNLPGEVTVAPRQGRATACAKRPLGIGALHVPHAFQGRNAQVRLFKRRVSRHRCPGWPLAIRAV